MNFNFIDRKMWSKSERLSRRRVTFSWKIGKSPSDLRYDSQSHYTNYTYVARWGISSSARHNWLCFYSLFWIKKIKSNSFFIKEIMQHFSEDATMFNFFYFFPWKHKKTALISSTLQPKFLFTTANWPRTSPNIKFCSIKKSDNLQYNMLGRWVDHLINQASNNPSSILIDKK